MRSPCLLPAWIIQSKTKRKPAANLAQPCSTTVVSWGPATSATTQKCKIMSTGLKCRVVHNFLAVPFWQASILQSWPFTVTAIMRPKRPHPPPNKEAVGPSKGPAEIHAKEVAIWICPCIELHNLILKNVLERGWMKFDKNHIGHIPESLKATWAGQKSRRFMQIKVEIACVKNCTYSIFEEWKHIPAVFHLHSVSTTTCLQIQIDCLCFCCICIWVFQLL